MRGRGAGEAAGHPTGYPGSPLPAPRTSRVGCWLCADDLTSLPNNPFHFTHRETEARRGDAACSHTAPQWWSQGRNPHCLPPGPGLLGPALRGWQPTPRSRSGALFQAEQAKGSAGQRKPRGRRGSNEQDSFPCQAHAGPPGSSEQEGQLGLAEPREGKEAPPSTAAAPLFGALWTLVLLGTRFRESLKILQLQFLEPLPGQATEHRDQG